MKIMKILLYIKKEIKKVKEGRKQEELWMK